MMLAAIGIAIGLVGAAAASQAVASLLYGVSRLDPVTYVGVIVLLGGVALGSVWHSGVAGSEGGSGEHAEGGVKIVASVPVAS